MRKISVLWLVVLAIVMLVLATAPAGSLAFGSGGAWHVACQGGSGSGGCQG